MINTTKYCMNCGQESYSHSCIVNESCLKELNQKMLNVYLFDPKELPEERGLASSLQVPQITPTIGMYS